VGYRIFMGYGEEYREGNDGEKLDEMTERK
jgi:hypothetical protein